MFDRFAKEKSDFLSKKDKSRKGSIDKNIKKLVEKINSKNDYFTTSSCSGRILLIKRKSLKKDDAEWLFVSHGKVKAKDILNNLKKSRYPIWLKQEPFILHIACRNIGSAKKFLGLSRALFKRAGIISITDKKCMIEIIGTERIEIVVADRNFMADKKFVQNSVKHANLQLDRNKKRINEFLGMIRNID